MSGYLDIWISGYLDIWISGYLNIWISGYLDIWISGYLDIWIFGYLDIWIFGYLDSGQNNGLMHPQSGLLCGVALPGFVFPRKKTVPGVFAT